MADTSVVDFDFTVTRLWYLGDDESDLLGFKYKAQRDAADNGVLGPFVRTVCPKGYVPIMKRPC